jgi:phosphoribosylanthranilate isomerase
MEIHRQGGAPLSPAQEQVLAHYREQLHERALHGGLTPENVQDIVRAVRAHPDVSFEVLEVLFDEVKRLPDGQRLLSFE